MTFEHTNNDNNFEFNTCEHFASVKLFGLLENEIEELLLPFLCEISDNLKLQIIANGYDILLKIGSNGDKKEFDSIVKTVYKIFAEYIYADEEISLEKQLMNCLTLFSQKLIVFEQESQGILCGKLAKIQDSKSCLLEALVVPEIENVKKLPMCKNFNLENGQELASQIANYMLCERNGAISVAILKKNEQIIIALADSEKTSVFRHDFDSLDSNYLENIVNTTLFYLVKKSKQNDLKFC